MVNNLYVNLYVEMDLELAMRHEMMAIILIIWDEILTELDLLMAILDQVVQLLLQIIARSNEIMDI